MATIAADWLADWQLEHCTLTIDETSAHYVDMLWEEREGQFREVHVDAACNHHLLQEHLQMEERLAGRAVPPNADMVEQEALLESYRTARHIHLASWRYR